MKDVYFHLGQLFGDPVPKKPSTELNGIEAANRAVAECDPDSSMIFLTKSEYEDLLARSRLPELKAYKKKAIMIVSDEAEELASMLSK